MLAEGVSLGSRDCCGLCIVVRGQGFSAWSGDYAWDLSLDSLH